jgi:competence protein ComEC
MFIRRPLFIISTFYIAGIGFGYIFVPGLWVLLCLIPGVITIALTKDGVRIVAVVSVIAFLTGSIYCQSELEKKDLLAGYAVSPYQNVVDGDSSAYLDMPRQYGRVIKIARSDNGLYRLTVRSEGRNVLLRVKPSNLSYGEDLPDNYDFEKSVLGQKISFRGEAELPSGRRNPGCFDYALYLKTQNIRIIIKCTDSDIGFVPGQDTLYSAYNGLGRIKYDFLAKSKAALSKESYALLSGMLFGDKSELDDDVYERFQHNGIAHILSVSGLHVMIVYGFITMLLGRRKTVPVYITIAFALICYAVLSEFSPSIIRAVMMIGVHIFSKLMSKRYDLLIGTSLAALIMLVNNPLSLFQTGFMLSFLAVYLLAFFLPLAARFTGRRDTRTGIKLSSRDLDARGFTRTDETFIKKAAGNLIPLFILQLGMAPLVAYDFNFISWTGFLLNLPVVFIAGFIIPIGLVMFAVSATGLPDLIFGFLLSVEELLLDSIDWLVRLADGLPFGHVQVVSPPAPLLFLFYLCVFLISSEGFRLAISRRRIKTVSVMLAAVMSVSMLTGVSNVCRESRDALTFVDVGQGDCLHVRTPDGHNYLIDGGGQLDYDVGKKVLLPYLLKNGVGHIDGVFASHLHTDHWRGLAQLAEYMDIEKVYMYEANSAKIHSTDGTPCIRDIPDAGGNELTSAGSMTPLIYIAQGDRVKLGEDVHLDVLYPSRKTPDEYEALTAPGADENKNSLLMRLDYDGVTVLMTGDLGEEGERTIISELKAIGKAELLRSRILKVGHHGSRTSTSDEFLAAVSPDIAVIQVGRNTFGHPTMPVLEKLAADDIMTYRNDTDGAVKFKIADGRINYGGTQFQENRARYQK